MASSSTTKAVRSVSGITVRLAGDSGDGMQLLGTQLTNTSALAGNDVATFPDFPAEIRAPRGTRAGVSGFQVQFASEEIYTPGDTLDALVVMNPAAMVTNLGDLRKGRNPDRQRRWVQRQRIQAGQGGCQSVGSQRDSGFVSDHQGADDAS